MRELLLVIVAVALIGCGQKEAPKSEQNSGNPITAPVDYVGAVGTAKKRAEANIDLTPVNRAILQFKSAEGRFPNDLNELITEGHLARAPQAPKGMRFDYNRATGAVRLIPE